MLCYAMLCYAMLQSVLEGKTDELPARVCDVRDVARAHIRAMEDPSSSGRYLITQPNNIPSKDIVAILQQRFPDQKKLKGKDGDSSPIIDNSKVSWRPSFRGSFPKMGRMPVQDYITRTAMPVSSHVVMHHDPSRM